jgi:cobalt/nickel transport system permease protein
VISETLAAGDSLVHRLDPRVKVVFATIFSFTVALLQQYLTLVVGLGVGVLLILVARYHWKDVGRRLVVANSLIFFLWIVVPWTFHGETIFHLGPLSATKEGVALAGRVTLKCNAILLAWMALVGSSPVSQLGHALDRMRVPPKLVYLLLITYRYIFVLGEEYRRLMRATKVRGFRPGTNMHTYRTYAYLIGMLFVRAADRAERVRQAMLCRGFHGRYYCLSEFSVSRRDWTCSILMASAVVGLIVLEWTRIT